MNPSGVDAKAKQFLGYQMRADCIRRYKSCNGTCPTQAFVDQYVREYIAILQREGYHE